LQNRTDIVFDAPTRPAADEDDDDEDTNQRYRYYRSEKILGQLYRAIDENKVWRKNVLVNRMKTDDSNVWDTFMLRVTEECYEKLGGIEWTDCIDEAWNIRRS
jgi:hypothetical protein